MPSRATVDWRGDALIRRVRAAAAAGVNETLDAAAADARLTHEWVSRTGQLEEEIVTEHARAGRNPHGAFGTTRRRGFYGLFHEEGTVREFARPFLRPAADRNFPTLARRIRRRLR
jgi:hypothetical protein